MCAAQGLAIAVISVAIGFVAPADAQAPAGDIGSGRAITLVVPIAAGGGMDTIGRAMAEKLQERLKQPVVVENRVGAGGVVGVDYVAKAAPDGRTLLLMDISAVLHRWLHRSVPFDVIADFAPVAQVATTPLLLFAHPSLPATDVKELIAYAKANAGNVGVWFGIAAPAKAPRDVIARLGKEIGEITKLPDLQKRLSALGYDLNFADSESLRELIATDHKRYGAVIHEAGIVPN